MTSTLSSWTAAGPHAVGVMIHWFEAHPVALITLWLAFLILI